MTTDPSGFDIGRSKLAGRDALIELLRSQHEERALLLQGSRAVGTTVTRDVSLRCIKRHWSGTKAFDDG